MLIAYGVGRVLMMVLNQIRDVLFLGQHAIRELNNRTFRHLRKLAAFSRAAHRRLSRDRARHARHRPHRAHGRDGPTSSDAAGRGPLVFYFDWTYVLILFATVAVYMWFTFSASERRIAIRREMNESDTDNTKAIDSLAFETVKYFGSEEVEARRYDASMARYEGCG